MYPVKLEFDVNWKFKYIPIMFYRPVSIVFRRFQVCKQGVIFRDLLHGYITALFV